MTVDDDYHDVPPSWVALAAVWPVLAGERVTLHDDDPCALYEGEARCTCSPLRFDGPTELA